MARTEAAWDAEWDLGEAIDLAVLRGKTERDCLQVVSCGLTSLTAVGDADD